MKSLHLTYALGLGLAMIGLAPRTASADIVQSYMAWDAENHALWFAHQRPAIVVGRTYHFEGGYGQLDLHDDGRLNLHGIVEKAGGGDPWAVDLWFESRGVGTAGEGTGGPKIERPAMLPNPHTSWTDLWHYFNLIYGDSTLTSLVHQTVLHPWERPLDSVFPFQMGSGANNKNDRMGGSGWFGYEFDGRDYKGDVNINIRPVPVPGAALLGLLGFGGIRGLRRWLL